LPLVWLRVRDKKGRAVAMTMTMATTAETAKG
jgi:hypothetical protein